MLYSGFGVQGFGYSVYALGFEGNRLRDAGCEDVHVVKHTEQRVEGMRTYRLWPTASKGLRVLGLGGRRDVEFLPGL